jgi:phosphatidylethanolamine/phosphatidyl-N-methylethanolamine N-methyltransferase
LDEAEFCSHLYGEIQSRGVCGRYVAISHKKLERRLGSLPTGARVLEVGGNLGEHLKFVKHEFASYIVSDYRETGFRSDDPRVRFEVADVEKLPYQADEFDRVISGCLLHHLLNPEAGLSEMHRVCKSGGLISLILPCDPGMLYSLGKVLGPYRSRTSDTSGVDLRLLHFRQHRNHYPGLVTAIEHIFHEDEIKRVSFPIPRLYWNLNLFTVFQIRKR